MSLLLVLLLPLVLVGLVLLPSTRRVGLALAPWAALPGLVLALTAPHAYTLELPWLLLGSRFGLDDTGRLFLAFTTLLWLAAGLYAHGYMAADGRKHVFTAFFLCALSANLGVCLAQDAASFYLAFCVMTFAAYGLVVHEGDAGARRAGRVYIAMAMLGEALLIAGLILLAGAAQTHYLPELARAAALQAPSLAYGLLFLGFGIKAGIPLLHMWLPLAHPAAPTPASAVLSGAMIKAGLLGWLRFLPLGEAGGPELLGAAMLGLGLFAAFFGVAIGLAQRDAKTLLAYSSVSQMGLMTLGVGAGMLAPAAWPALALAVMLYAAHHAIVKGALFLGVGVVRRYGARHWVLAGLVLSALSLAGAPLTSGALAKAELKAALYALPAPWPEVVPVALSLAAVATALLMARFLWLLGREPVKGTARGWVLPWLMLLAVGASGVFWLAPPGALPRLMTGAMLVDALGPLLVGIAIAALGWRYHWRTPALAAGDLLIGLEWVLIRIRRYAAAWSGPL